MSKRKINVRLIRFRDAPDYLGMDRNRFNAEVRPHVTEVRIGRQGIAFDVVELDAYADELIARRGVTPNRKRAGKLLRRTIRGSASATARSLARNQAVDVDFTEALTQLGLN